MGDYTSSELVSIFAMQGFAGISLFSVLLLMALGLAIIFGQMGVINMAHGEFMAVGAYTTYFMSSLTETYFPSFMPYYFIFAIVVAFFVAGVLGYLAEFVLIRHLYKRPLDTLLATWGLSLIMQQSFRTLFGAREVSPTLPDWLLGSYQPTETIDIPLNGMFVLALTAVVTLGVFYLLYKSSWGLRVRATTQNRVMSGAVGINTKKVDRYTFALGCGIAGIAGAAFTTIASTGPTTGTLYIVDTFMVVVFGGAASLIGTIVSAFSIAQAQSILEFFISGSMAKVYTLFALVLILMFKPEGLFASKVRR
ncbi:urea ABC transporter permease subunit UrtB [Cocleimonas sp. KMM 6892]|jgi:urea transport system permease protein|uniref:urea ABC transporter permease subunit UrtB n=1 Tax=unclassified Cocleimonas TaxID=2639732 RepID=UPI002DB9EDCE|nr:MULTISPECIES: urea ABC transporter permease subunit UrtB [unclassified Cocleimonas]MEB8431417.1 urea ABC transporter permease subunit UrtB [Cocleimonas sp. KMM 6892]MEC4713811.1 urea ABC transporter permease subunit UrtB [Cocleimonas sp. KMM 6895]MEC4743142.1 urea ABC transporter permease subunit UrtB [Cocleimonas sp. KMM 6896]